MQGKRVGTSLTLFFCCEITASSMVILDVVGADVGGATTATKNKARDYASYCSPGILSVRGGCLFDWALSMVIPAHTVKIYVPSYRRGRGLLRRADRTAACNLGSKLVRQDRRLRPRRTSSTCARRRRLSCRRCIGRIRRRHGDT